MAAGKERMRQACERGGTSLYTTGIHPGVVSDAMLFALTSMSQKIESITALEMLDCSSYDAPVLSALGFGWTPAEDAKRFNTRILHYYWGRSSGSWRRPTNCNWMKSDIFANLRSLTAALRHRVDYQSSLGKSRACITDCKEWSAALRW
jgi:hypothetical protein